MCMYAYVYMCMCVYVYVYAYVYVYVLMNRLNVYVTVEVVPHPDYMYQRDLAGCVDVEVGVEVTGVISVWSRV